jgi:hypothetical protein
LKIQVTHRGQQLIALKIGGYEIVRNGKQRKDREIGHSVFNVKVGGLKFIEDRLATIYVSLQNYSDQESWKIFLEYDGRMDIGYRAVINSFFKSSDGDDRLHVNALVMSCSTERSR